MFFHYCFLLVVRDPKRPHSFQVIYSLILYLVLINASSLAHAQTGDPALNTAVPYYINAGGDTSGFFMADNGYTGGTPFTTRTPIDRSEVITPAPEKVYQSERFADENSKEPSFGYHFPKLTAGKSYRVRLHFAEIYYKAPGERFFHVLINQQPVLSFYDIYQAADGRNKALVNELIVKADSSGSIAVHFVNVKGGAKVSAIEILSAIETQYSLDAGSSGSEPFVADAYYNQGSIFTTTAPIDLTGVTNPAPASVYQSERYSNQRFLGGSFSYTFPNLAAGKSYLIRLHFAEIRYNSPGDRILIVDINGKRVLPTFDIFRESGGKNKAIIKEIMTTADENGQIIALFSSYKGGATVSGIQVLLVGENAQKVNAGGSVAGFYLADARFKGGHSFNSWAPVDRSGVTDPAPESVYQSERYTTASNKLNGVSNLIEYNFKDLALQQTYKVRLHFAENYYNAPGQRKFNVLINGKEVLNDFDILAEAGGKHRALVKEFYTTIDQNTPGSGARLIIWFSDGSAGEAKINGIEIIPQESKTSSGRMALSSGNSDALPLTLTPNPAADATQLQFSSPESRSVQVILRNSLSQVVQQTQYQTTSGNNTLNLNVSGLPSGVYYVTLLQAGKPITRKLLVTQGNNK